MGDIFKAVTSVFGGGEKAPTVSTAAVADVKADKKKTKKDKVALTGARGARGEELAPGQVSGQTQKLFGN